MRKYVANGHAVRRHVFDGKVMPGNSSPVSKKGRKGNEKKSGPFGVCMICTIL